MHALQDVIFRKAITRLFRHKSTDLNRVGTTVQERDEISLNKPGMRHNRQKQLVLSYTRLVRELEEVHVT